MILAEKSGQTSQPGDEALPARGMMAFILSLLRLHDDAPSLERKKNKAGKPNPGAVSPGYYL